MENQHSKYAFSELRIPIGCKTVLLFKIFLDKILAMQKSQTKMFMQNVFKILAETDHRCHIFLSCTLTSLRS